jgi:hypothetical protein
MLPLGIQRKIAAETERNLPGAYATTAPSRGLGYVCMSRMVGLKPIEEFRNSVAFST